MYGRRARENGGYFGAAAEDTADPNWGSCVFCLSGQGANGSTPATDTTGKSLTWAGNAQVVTSGTPAFYGSHVYLDGTGDYITVPDSAAWDIGTVDFTFKTRLKYAATGAGWAVCQGNDLGSSDSAWGLFKNAGHAWSFYYSTSGTAWVGLTLGTFTPTVGQYYSIELSRSGSTVYMFVDGVLLGTGTTSGTVYNSTRALAIGGSSDGASTINAYLTDVQFYNGVCLHTSSFIPPTRDALCSARRYPGGVYGL